MSDRNVRIARSFVKECQVKPEHIWTTYSVTLKGMPQNGCEFHPFNYVWKELRERVDRMSLDTVEEVVQDSHVDVALIQKCLEMHASVEPDEYDLATAVLIATIAMQLPIPVPSDNAQLPKERRRESVERFNLRMVMP